MKTSKLLPDPVKILALLLGSCLSILAAGKAPAQTADLFASVNHPDPTGPGAVFQYTPAGAQSTFVASVVQPRGVVFDCAGNLFAASTGFDNNGNAVGSILKVTPGGVVSTFTTGFPLNYFLEDIKFDSLGNLFVMAQNDSDPNVASTIFEVSPGGGVTIFGNLPGQGFGLAFDSMGNLFAADASDKIIYEFTPAGMRSVFSSAFLANQGPIGLAFNSAGNLFVSTSDNTNGQILEFAPNGAETTFATGLTNNPRGLAFDSAGNLFVAEPGRFRSGDILKFTPGGVETFFATPVGRPQGDGGPEFLAFPPLACPFGGGGPGCANPLMGSASDCTVFETNGSTVTISGPSAVNGSVCVGSNGALLMSGSANVSGKVELATGAKFSKSGPATTGGVNNNVDLSSQIAAVQNAATNATAMCSTFSGSISSTQTITGTGSAKVLCLQNVNLSNGSVLTLTGPSGTTFTINVKGIFMLSGGSKIVVGGAVQPKDVLINVVGGGQDATVSGGSFLQGTLLAPKRSITISGSISNGEIFSFQPVYITGGSKVTCSCAAGCQ